MEYNPQSQLKILLAKGREQGYLTYAEINDHLPPDMVDSDHIEDIIQMINDMGIQVVEEAPDADSLCYQKTRLTKMQQKHRSSPATVDGDLGHHGSRSCMRVVRLSHTRRRNQHRKTH